METVHSFATRGTFSQAYLVLQNKQNKEGHAWGVTLDHLIDAELLELLDHPDRRSAELAEPMEDLISMLNKCQTTSLTFKKNASEKQVFVEISKKIFIPLFGKLVFEKGYSKYVKGVDGASVENIGFGSESTWHGEPDARIRGCSFISANQDLSENNEDVPDCDRDEDITTASQSASAPTTSADIDSSPGNSSQIEAKKIIDMRKDISQLVATTVTSSFLEGNRHPLLNPLVPCLLMNKLSFRICLYDSKNDVLLISKPRLLSNEAGTISKTAVFILWLVINHRLFFKSLGDMICQRKSNIKQRLQDDDALKHFKRIFEKNVDWSSFRYRETSPPIVLLPPEKKRKPK